MNQDFINQFLNKWDSRFRRFVKLETLIPAALGFGAGSLFGGGGGSQTQVVPQSSIRGGQEALIDRLAGFLRPQIGQEPRVPGAELGPVGPSQLQQQAFGFAGQLPSFLQGPAFQQFDPGQITQQFQPTADFARQGFREETIPAIAAAVGAAGGARSSGFQDIIARQGRNLELGLASQLGQQQFGAQQALLGRQAQLPGLAGQLGTQLANIGGLQRGIGAEQQAFDLQRFQQQDPLRNRALGLSLQTSGLQTFQEPGIIPGTPGTLQQLLPLAGQVFGAAGQAGGFGNLFAGLGGLFN